MNREEAVAYFEGWHLSPNAEDLYVSVRVNVGKMRAAIAAMTCPWVKTSDRLPTEADANKESMVLGWDATLGYRDVDYKFIVTYPRFIPWWMPIPPLPEVEG